MFLEKIEKNVDSKTYVMIFALLLRRGVSFCHCCQFMLVQERLSYTP